MNLFRSILETPNGQFLVDAEHEDSELNALKIHPIVDGKVLSFLPLCQLENVEILIRQLKETIAALS